VQGGVGVGLDVICNGRRRMKKAVQLRIREVNSLAASPTAFLTSFAAPTTVSLASFATLPTFSPAALRMDWTVFSSGFSLLACRPETFCSETTGSG